MSDFTTILNNTVVASSSSGVRCNNNYMNIHGADFLAMLRPPENGYKDGRTFYARN